MKSTTGNLPRERTVSAPLSDDKYVPTWTDTRPGSQDHEKVPTLHCGARYYRDGRVESAT